MYELIIDNKAINFLNKHPKEIRSRIFDKIVQTKEDPLRFFERLAGKKGYKLRIGSYRVIADINPSLKRI